jgi:hypothetical protein
MEGFAWPAHHHLLAMAKRGAPAVNDPMWSGRAALLARPAMANVQPLRNRAGVCYLGIPPHVIKAWLYRVLKSAGPPV